jgi:adenylate kinase family enzyme
VGKGTYASRIAKRLGVAHIATGDLIRDEIKAGSTVGQQVRQGEAAFEVVVACYACIHNQALSCLSVCVPIACVDLQMQSIVNAGKLVPDNMIFNVGGMCAQMQTDPRPLVLSAESISVFDNAPQLLHKRLDIGRSERGEQGFILDGFPRTQHQVSQNPLPSRCSLATVAHHAPCVHPAVVTIKLDALVPLDAIEAFVLFVSSA